VNLEITNAQRRQSRWSDKDSVCSHLKLKKYDKIHDFFFFFQITGYQAIKESGLEIQKINMIISTTAPITAWRDFPGHGSGVELHI
jgi:hypothetical protein